MMTYLGPMDFDSMANNLKIGEMVKNCIESEKKTVQQLQCRRDK